MNDDKTWQFLRASCSIPGYFPSVKINGSSYYDGGLVSPVPVTKAFKDGCTKAVIILTQPEGYIKKVGKGNIAVSQLIKHKYPQLEMVLLARHRIYNKQIAFCRELEKRGKALIICPPQKLESFEHNPEKLRANWSSGYNAAMDRIEEIRAFVGDCGNMYD